MALFSFVSQAPLTRSRCISRSDLNPAQGAIIWAIIDILAQQAEYYRARAPEYEEWFFRLGRYDRGPAANARWFEDVEQVRAALDEFHPSGRVLELACGTGLWTEQLLPFAASLTCVDASSEMLELNRKRIGPSGIEYIQANLFEWKPPVAAFDVVFFGFWLSHVPPERFVGFWEMVKRSLAPGGRVFFVDSRHEPTSTAADHELSRPSEITADRLLNDGRGFRIVKVFYELEALADRLGKLGLKANMHVTPTYFLYGSASTPR